LHEFESDTEGMQSIIYETRHKIKCTTVNECYKICEIAGFPCGAEDVLTLLVCYCASVGSCLPTFRESLSVLSLRDMQTLLSKMGPKAVPKRR